MHPTWVEEGDVLQAPSSLALLCSTATKVANADVTSSSAVHMSKIDTACPKNQSCLLHMADSQKADHSCVRMHNPDLLDLFDRVPVGTRVDVLEHG